MFRTNKPVVMIAVSKHARDQARARGGWSGRNAPDLDAVARDLTHYGYADGQDYGQVELADGHIYVVKNNTIVTVIK